MNVDVESYFRAIFFILSILMMIIRAYYGFKARRRGDSSWSVANESVDREGQWSIFMRGFLFLYMLVVVVIYAINPEWLALFAIRLTHWSRWIGGFLSVLSLPFLVWVHHTLGEEWSTNLRFREGHQLITGGPYRWVRHPMYTVLFIFFIGLTLLSANWLVFVLVAASIVVLYRRIGIEEAMMIENFGDEYRAYMMNTGRLFPKFARKSKS